jgi:hypothetical protein
MTIAREISQVTINSIYPTIRGKAIKAGDKLKYKIQ